MGWDGAFGGRETSTCFAFFLSGDMGRGGWWVIRRQVAVGIEVSYLTCRAELALGGSGYRLEIGSLS